LGLLEVKDVKKTYGKRKAVDGLSFSVQEGEVYGLLGPNGAGKSTMLAMICGLLKMDQGSICIGGVNISKRPQEAKRKLGVVPQEPALYPTLSAEENLRFWGTMNGISPGDILPAVKKALQVVGLEERARGRVDQFSGGMKRRLNIAAGLIHNPEVLVMDEPTVGIDPQSRKHILETVKMLKRQGMTIIYTGHYVEEIEYLCDRVGIMDSGKMILEGTIAELLSNGSEYQQLRIILDRMPKEIPQAVESIPGVERAFSQEKTLNIVTLNAERILPSAFEAIVGLGVSVSEIKITKPSLESLFLEETGKALRDN